MPEITVGDRDYCRRLLVHNLKATEPRPGIPAPSWPEALANMRENIASAPAFSFQLRVIVRVLERLLAMGEVASSKRRRTLSAPYASADIVEGFRVALEQGDERALDTADECLAAELEASAVAACPNCTTPANDVKINASPIAVVLALLVALLVACASSKARQACRDECEPQRGPTWTLMGGPTLPPDAFLDCVDACRTRSKPPDPPPPPA